jgi:hypothetical protein
MNIRFSWAARVGTLALIAFTAPITGSSDARAADAAPLDTDPNVDLLAFGGTDAFVFGDAYSQDDAASFNGNDLLVQTQAGFGGGAGAGFSVPVSNGENGKTESFDGGANEVLNPDIDNATPPNSVFTTIGNASGKLENGNVIRWSAWMRIDPNNPVTVAPQIEPVFKFEFWKEALSTFADTNGGQAQPFFGDKIIDSDQHLGAGIWIDLDNDGAVIDAAAAGSGRIRTINSTGWTLIEAVHVVDDTQWIGIADDFYSAADVEEIRSVMFWGDFAGTDFTADGDDGGSLWFDNLLVEIFKDQASVTPNTNPDPALSEGGLAGDFDNDHDVDGDDLTVWESAFGMTAAGDADNDGDSDGHDFLIWQQHLGGPGLGAVPEPTSAALLFGGWALLAGAMARRRR